MTSSPNLETGRPRPLLPLRNSDLDSTSNMELMQTLENLEILRRFTGYAKQRTKTRERVLRVLTIFFILFGLCSGVFILGEGYTAQTTNTSESNNEHTVDHSNNIVFIPPPSSSPLIEPTKITTKRQITESKTKSPNTTTTPSSSKDITTAATEINKGSTTKAINTATTPAGSSNKGTSINTDHQTTSDPHPQIIVISNLTESSTKGPKIPKDIVSMNPTQFLHIVAGQHVKHWHLDYKEMECMSGAKVVGHKAICEFRDQKFIGYASRKKNAKTIASRKAVEHYYNVKFPVDSKWGAIPEDESFSTYC